MKRNEWLKQPDDSSLFFKKNAKHDLVKKAKEYININYRGKFCIDYVSSALYVNKYYLMRTFKELTGSTLLKYLNEVRCASAKEMLEKTDTNIEIIAYSVGYATASHFAKVFKSIYGKTPSAIRAGL